MKNGDQSETVNRSYLTPDNQRPFHKNSGFMKS
nr:MAG TPA: hypothetical protein [Caudoviricetes sp.]